MVVYLYWSRGWDYQKVWTCRRLSVTRSSEIALPKVCLLYYVRRTVLILCGKTATWNIFESKRSNTHMPLMEIILSNNYGINILYRKQGMLIFRISFKLAWLFHTRSFENHCVAGRSICFDGKCTMTLVTREKRSLEKKAMKFDILKKTIFSIGKHNTYKYIQR